jgi:hypothetical protein
MKNPIDLSNCPELVPYFPDFLTRAEADELFRWVQTQPHERPIIKRSGLPTRCISYPGYSEFPELHRKNATGYETQATKL